VKSYLFNTQLINLPNDEMVIIAPLECQQNKAVYSYLQSLVAANNPITNVHYFDVKQSMQNGGGPACLRLRVALTEREQAAVNSACLMNDATFKTLQDWVNKHYRDRIHADDLADPQLLLESRTALDELTTLLKLGPVYRFQM
jgi:succinylarginine dihydrolase